MGLYIGIAILSLVAKCWKKSKIVYDYLKTILIHGFMLRFIIESYLEIVISLILQLYKLSFANSSDTFASIVCFFGVGILGTFPIVVTIFLFKYLNKLETNSDLKTKYGSLYSELRTHKRATVLYTTLFLIRRLVFAFTAIFLTSWPFI